MDLHDKVVLVTGTGRGLGKAIVEMILTSNVKKVYATELTLDGFINFGDERVVPLKLDITNDADVAEAARVAKDVQILINNAGVISFGSILDTPMEKIKHDMDVNYYGTLKITRAFVPILKANSDCAIVIVSSIVGLSSMHDIGGFSASKAAISSVIQSIRSELRPHNIFVYGVFPGPIDTDMVKDWDVEKAAPMSVAENMVKGMMAKEEYIFPDKISKQDGILWLAEPKKLDRKRFGEDDGNY